MPTVIEKGRQTGKPTKRLTDKPIHRQRDIEGRQRYRKIERETDIMTERTDLWFNG